LIESVKSILPITVVILIAILFIPVEQKVSVIFHFLIGAVFLAVGLALFQMGAFESMSVIAEDIGKYIVKRRNVAIFVSVSFMLGFLIIIAEPSVRVLAEQLKGTVNPYFLIIIVVALGVGVFLTVGLLRILFDISYIKLLTALYFGAFLLAIYVNRINPAFVPLAFDSGGFASGPLSVPFIMSLAYGMSKGEGFKESEQDSFGLVGITIIGPIFAVLLLGLFFKIDPKAVTLTTVYPGLIESLLQYIFDMLIAVLPFIGFFIFFQIIDFKYSRKKVFKILIAFAYTYVGLVLFLAGANSAYSQIGSLIGEYLGANGYSLILILGGGILGLLVAAPEPSVIAVNNQVEEVTAGSISKKLMLIAISLGVMIAMVISMIRVLTGINILWVIIPGYLISLVLAYFTPKIFCGIAFDAGSAVSGAMTTAFLMPFAIGASIGFGGTPMMDAYGLVVCVSMAPVICIQILGLIYKQKERKLTESKDKKDIMDKKVMDKKDKKDEAEYEKGSIIEIDEEIKEEIIKEIDKKNTKENKKEIIKEIDKENTKESKKEIEKDEIIDLSEVSK